MASSKNQTDTEKAASEEAAEDRCSVEEVALVVPETDDPSLPVMTFRAWFLVHGGDASNHGIQRSGLEIQLESWAFQYERACYYHNIC